MSDQNEFIHILYDTSDSDSGSDSDSDEIVVAPTRGRPKKIADVYINLVETFNQDKLNHILTHTDDYKMRKTTGCYNPYSLATKYLIKSHNGSINVCYKQNEGVGRFNACGSLSMQTLPREIRHTIAEGYTDIDIENAHPVILHFLCKERHILTTQLKKYIKNRDEYLAKISDDRQLAKETVISVLNGGNAAYDKLENKPVWLKRFKTEMSMIHKEFAKDTAFKAHKRNFNREGSYVNLKMCEVENNILMCMYKEMGSTTNDELCFDGKIVKDTND